MDEPLVGEDAYRMIGSVVSRAEGVVVKKEFQRWAAATDDWNPLYFDAEYARAHGYEDVIAPPLYVSYVTLGVARLDRLRPDGTPAGDGSADVPLPRCPRLMAGGQSMTFHEPLYDGTVVTAEKTILDIVQKHGRSGAFVLVTSTTSVRRRGGGLVADITDTLIARP